MRVCMAHKTKQQKTIWHTHLWCDHYRWSHLNYIRLHLIFAAFGLNISILFSLFQFFQHFKLSFAVSINKILSFPRKLLIEIYCSKNGSFEDSGLISLFLSLCFLDFLANHGQVINKIEFCRVQRLKDVLKP